MELECGHEDTNCLVMCGRANEFTMYMALHSLYEQRGQLAFF